MQDKADPQTPDTRPKTEDQRPQNPQSEDFWPIGEITKIVDYLESAGLSKTQIYEDLLYGPAVLDAYWSIVLIGKQAK